MVEFPPSYTLLLQILEHYSDHPYPRMRDLIRLTPTPNTTPPKTPPVKSIVEEKKPETPPAPIEQPPLPPTPRVRRSSWDYHPPVMDLSKLDILQLRYRTLQAHLSTTKNICGIFISEDNTEDMSFFNRLIKVLTKRLFPTSLVLITNSKHILHTQETFLLSLAPLPLLQPSCPHARYHQSFIQNGSTWLPIYPSVYYENDLHLKRDLWNLLNKQPFAYTQKS